MPKTRRRSAKRRIFLEGKISRIETGSLAEELELEVGDKILKVNGKTPLDIIDLSFLLAEEEIELLIEHADGEREFIEFEKDVDEELGAEFESAVFDKIRRCKNNCVFCFVNMIAPNMRKTLSIKDDDYRLSFLFGNFITLTNLTAKDFRRIKNYHLSPLFVSVHTMNPALRAKMLRTPLGANINQQLDELEKSGVEYHTQVVLCKDLNDGSELDFTIAEILKRRPHAQSLAIVPVGVTKYRRDKFLLKQFDKESAEKVIAQVEAFQKKIRAETGRTFVYLGDEFYLLAERELPPAEFYDDFPQLENGIGMTRNFIEEFGAAEIKIVGDKKIDVVSGTSFAKVLKRLVNAPNVRILPVENKFFGGRVNVSGLLTGCDIIAALDGGERDLILIPATALKAGEEIFLDDVTLKELKNKFLPAKVIPIHDGKEFRRILEEKINE
ncbi:MAG: DUF512 domain-containing protein [Selenomonadaceae bacterium]|nr:DUF512 domain-containing protein [Selenomonadaceae bacterium]